MLNLFGDNTDVFHGTGFGIIKNPDIIKCMRGHYKDFGYGFYVTYIEEQAKRWAGRRNTPVVNVYNFDVSILSKLRVLKFEGCSVEWADFIAECRTGVSHTYDIVEGPMADDNIWDYCKDYISGNISKEIFIGLCEFRKPTHQIVFCNQQTIDNVLTFKGGYNI